ncbi:MAG: YkgJ family cysteine cluster protein [Candidatus Melainabacteria bacterium]|nr:YkgJ family cysteine cluster protein [Candidatus Melainabacteria bacterium]
MFDLNYHGTQAEFENQQKEPLPDLCHKCGRCCRSATTYHSYQKLLELAGQGDKEAIDFLSIFEPYESVEAALAAVPEQVEQVLDVVRKRVDMDEAELTFYHCRFVTPEGLCGIYERRPRCCKEAPGHGWAVMPPGCGFEGWQFEQREKQKRMVRDLKSTAYLLAQMSPDGVSHPTRSGVTLADMEAMVEEKIAPWKQFGADHW